MGLCDELDLVRGTFKHANLGGEQFDVIVSNPPYIARGDKRVNAGARFDPSIALYAGNDGLAAYEQIADHARSWFVRYLQMPGGNSCVRIKTWAVKFACWFSVYKVQFYNRNRVVFGIFYDFYIALVNPLF